MRSPIDLNEILAVIDSAAHDTSSACHAGPVKLEGGRARADWEEKMNLTEIQRWQRLRELSDLIAAKRRYDQPPNADQWVLAYEDVDDEQGRTVRHGVPVWTPKAEIDEWQRLHFQSSRDDEQNKTAAPRYEEPFFITEKVEAEMRASGYDFEPPAHLCTTRPREVLAGISDTEKSLDADRLKQVKSPIG